VHLFYGRNGPLMNLNPPRALRQEPARRRSRYLAQSGSGSRSRPARRLAPGGGESGPRILSAAQLSRLAGLASPRPQTDPRRPPAAHGHPAVPLAGEPASARKCNVFTPSNAAGQIQATVTRSASTISTSSAPSGTGCCSSPHLRLGRRPATFQWATTTEVAAWAGRPDVHQQLHYRRVHHGFPTTDGSSNASRWDNCGRSRSNLDHPLSGQTA